MESKQDADGFALPQTPASTISRSYAQSVTPSNIGGASTSSNRKKGLVEDHLYRDVNLAVNNMYIRPSYGQFPEDIARLVDYVRRDRDSLGLSSDQLNRSVSQHSPTLR
jgi:hypothetical protein